MAKEFAKAFYKSNKWLKCRNAYIAERINVDGGLCEECHDSIGYIVHHKILLNETNISDPMISLNHDNLEYVCKNCHDEFDGHGIKYKCKKGEEPLCLFDNDGQPISIRDIDINKDYRLGIDSPPINIIGEKF